MTLLNCCRDVSLVQGKPHQIAINDGRGFRHGHPVAMNGDPTGNMPLNDERGFRRGHPVAMNGAPTGLCTFVGCVFIRTWGCARQSVNLQPSPKPDKGWNAGPWSKASHARDGDPTGCARLNDGRKFRRGHSVAMNGDPTGLCTFVGCVFIRTRKMCTAVSKPSAITEAG